MATISKSSRLRSHQARRNWRPVRPKPLIPTRMVMASTVLSVRGGSI